MKEFKPGEIGILLYSEYRPECVGWEMEVTGGLMRRMFIARTTGEVRDKVCYYARDPEGKKWALNADQIKRKPPSRDDLRVVRWEDCPWQPERAMSDAGAGQS